MNRENDFVPYKMVKKLEKIGFSGSAIGLYYDKGKKLYYGNAAFTSTKHESTLAPLYSEIFRWFREEHKLHCTITSISQESWQWHITKPGESLGKVYDEDFYTYEEAEEACLEKLIEISGKIKSGI